MAKFIPIDKMSKLRESAKNGDEHARKILDMQMSGGDFGALLDEYFQPKPEVVMEKDTVETKSMPQKKTKLEEFLEFNNVSKDSPDYDSFVEDFYREFPNERNVETHEEIHEEEHEDGFEEWMKKLMAEESDAIDSYSKAMYDDSGKKAKRKV